MALQSLTSPFSPLSSAPVYCKEVGRPKQPCSEQPDGFESVCCETLWCSTSSLPCFSAHFSIPPQFSCARWGKMSTRVFRLSKIHTSLFLYIWQETTWNCGIMENRQAPRQLLWGRQQWGPRTATSEGFITSGYPRSPPPPLFSLSHSLILTSFTLLSSRNFNAVPSWVCPHQMQACPRRPALSCPRSAVWPQSSLLQTLARQHNHTHKALQELSHWQNYKQTLSTK